MQRFKESLATVIAAFLAAALNSLPALAQSDQLPTADDLNLGETVPEGEVQVGQLYVVETNGAWDVRCVKVAEGRDPCEMYQLLSDVQGTPIAEVVLFELPDGQAAAAGATVVVPLETALQEQLTIKVDDDAAKRYPFAFCNQVGCHARIGLTEEEVSAYRRGAAAVISIVPMLAPDQRVEVGMSLSGFTASYEKVAEMNGT